MNYVCSHDGFNMRDLVSYTERRNWANGHNNTDGMSDNFSWNCGWEGDDGVPAEVVAMRKQQVKNLFALLMLANGTPMFCAGDEFFHTQGGNNNPYNQDNETTWLDWSQLEAHRDLFSLREGHDRVSQGSPVAGSQHVLARRRPLVRCRQGRRHGLGPRVRWRSACMARRCATTTST